MYRILRAHEISPSTPQGNFTGFKSHGVSPSPHQNKIEVARGNNFQNNHSGPGSIISHLPVDDFLKASSVSKL